MLIVLLLPHSVPFVVFYVNFDDTSSLLVAMKREAYGESATGYDSRAI